MGKLILADSFFLKSEAVPSRCCDPVGYIHTPKLISKDFPVVSTADVVLLVLSTAGFVEQGGQTA
jgi:hypothetical protein